MNGLIRNELIKLSHNKKVYALLLTILLTNMVPVVLTLLIRLRTMDGQSYPSMLFGIIASWILPLFLLTLVAEMITEEAAAGTLSLTLVHPVSRVQVITAKVVALFILIIITLLFALIVSYGVGTLFFGWGREFLMRGVTYSPWQGVYITVVSYIATTLPLLSFCILVIFLALIMSSGASVVGISVGLLLLFSILEILIKEIKPYVISSYFSSLSTTFLANNRAQLLFSLSFLTIHSLVFYLASLMIFEKRDVLN